MIIGFENLILNDIDEEEEGKDLMYGFLKILVYKKQILYMEIFIKLCQWKFFQIKLCINYIQVYSYKIIIYYIKFSVIYCIFINIIRISL